MRTMIQAWHKKKYLVCYLYNVANMWVYFGINKCLLTMIQGLGSDQTFQTFSCK